MDSSVSGKDETWFLRVCHHVPHELYNILIGNHSNYINYKHFANMKDTVWKWAAKGYVREKRLGTAPVGRYRRYRGVYSIHLQGDLILSRHITNSKNPRDHMTHVYCIIQ